jgi:hypothetical protein
MCPCVSVFAIDPPDDKTAPYTVALGGGEPKLTGDWSTYNGNLIVGTGTGDNGKLNTAGLSLGTSATVTVSENATLWINGKSGFSNAITLGGGALKESFGQLRVDNGANVSGAITLLANSSIGGG